jgi:hypothetical protein
MVDMFRKAGRRKRVLKSELRDGATLLSIRQNLIYQATVGIDDIESTLVDLPKGEFATIHLQLRELLNTEFGSLRVHKHRYAFTVGAHCLESLIAGLLRVQYHAKQIETTLVVSEMLDHANGLPVTWGVGNTISEAETERSKRRALKRS